MEVGGQYAAELRILLVYLSETLGRLSKNGGTGGHIFHWGAAAPLTPRRTAPDYIAPVYIALWDIIGFNACSTLAQFTAGL